MQKKSQSLIEALRLLLRGKKAHTQEALCKALEKLGYETNQSKISRLLRRLGAIKVTNIDGAIVYSLPRDPAPPSIATPLGDLILHIACNQALVVILTNPGSASIIARILDHNQINVEILGTIAGDDTIFVAPKSTQDIQQLMEEIKALLYQVN